MAICKPFDVIVVPFPFTDRKAGKRRPAVALSSETFSRTTGHSVLAMITSAQNPPWLFDVPIDAQKCGLHAPSKVRFKLFTLDNRLILHRVGTLADTDRKRVADAFHRVADL